MRTIGVVLAFVLLVSGTAFATPLRITDGFFREGLGGVNYDFSGRSFSAMGTDSMGMAGVLNGVSYVHADLVTFTLTPRAQSNRYDFSGLLHFSNPGNIFARAEVEGRGIGTLTTFAGLTTNLTVAFGNSGQEQRLTATPEPGTWLLLATGLIGVWGWRRLRPKRNVYVMPWS